MLRPMLPLPERRGNTSILPKKKKLQQSKQDNKDNDSRNNDSRSNNNNNNNSNNNNNVDDNNNTIRHRTLPNLYKGNHIEIEPNDELKQLRKSLGIIIKGSL